MFQSHRQTLVNHKVFTHRKGLVIALSFALSSSLLIGCSGKEERQTKYLQRAEEYLAKKDYDKARIEAKNVLQINANNAQGHYIFAEVAEHENNFQQMFAELNIALQYDPKLLKAQVKLAQLLTAGNQLEKASAAAEKIHAIDPNNPDYYSVRSGIALRQQKTDEAIENAQKALKIQPGNLSASAVLASIYADTDPAKAHQVLADSVKVYPEEEDLRLMQARLYAKQNEPDKAIEVIKQLIKKYPEKVAYVSQLALYYIQQNRPGDAEALLHQSIKDQPRNTDLKLALVEFVAKQRKSEDALALLEQYSKAEPDNYKLRATLARFYLATNAPDKALSTYQYTIDKDVHGEGIDARNRVIEIYLSQKKRPEAEALLKDVLKLEPENADALMMRARLELADNNPDSAIADVRTVLKNAPESPEALLLFAHAQERSGGANLALDTYKKILDKNGNDLGALLGAARLNIQQNQLEDAQKLLEHARSLAGTNVEVAQLLVNLYARKQQWQKAFELCDQLTLNSNSAAVGYYLKGVVLLQKKDTNEGIESLKKALEKEPRAIEPLQMLISAYVGTKQADTATTYLEAYVKAHPELIHAQELLGALYRQTGKLPQAQHVLEDVTKKEPKRISAYRELAQVYMDQKQPQQVGVLVNDAIKKNPDNIDLLLLQAQYAQSTGNNQLAVDSYEKALKLQPNSDIVKNNLAVLLIEKFPTEENLRRAQTLTVGFADSKNPLLIDTFAWLQYKMKNYQQAISLLQSILKDNIQAPELRYHLGMAYLKSGAADKAKIELTKATEAKAQYSGRDEAEAELKKL
jgi:tetratricopeptide (TPR) repeat protein